VVLIPRSLGQRLLCLLCGVLLPATAPAAPREERSLNGLWEVVKVSSLDMPPPREGWRDIEIPGFLQGHDYERAWFRRMFPVPDSWDGKRVLLRFNGVKFASRVLVNEVNVGGCFNGYDAFDLDITGAVRLGEPNELLVGVHDWTGVVAGDRADFRGRKDWMDLRGVPRDRVLSPIGGRFDLYGIWDDVRLLAVPPVYLADCVFRASTRQQRVTIDLTIANTQPTRFQSGVTARIYPYDGSPRDDTGAWTTHQEPVAVSETIPFTVSANQQEAVTIELADPPLEPWWPHAPQLYVLEVRLDENDGDCLHERVGYREFWTEGGDFYLNGAKVHLLARSWWPPDAPCTRETVADTIRTLKRMNANCFRTHTQPWPRRWYEVADELGLLMIPEAAVFNDDEIYRVEDPQFWDAYARHLQAMVGLLRNHPSVIMWSLENELHGVRARDNTPVEEELARMGRIVKALDPTRPITFESDGDPGGAADVIGLHYPNEYPQRRLWPNDAFWMDRPNTSRVDKMFWDAPYFLWERRKPLFIGEFLGAPDAAPATATLFFGDEVYQAPRTYHFRAKAEAWRMQIHAYRYYGVSGIAPWGYDYIKPEGDRRIVLLTQQAMFRPLAAFLRAFDSRFFGGQTVDRTVDLFNDTMVHHPAVRLEWCVVEKDQVTHEGRLTVDLPPGTHEEVVLSVPIPDVEERTPCSLRLALRSMGKEQFREEWPFHAFPACRDWSLPAVPLYLYDPQRTLRSIWEPAGVSFRILEDLEAWQGDGILIVGPGTPASEADTEPAIPVIGSPGNRSEALSKKVGAGGKVLVLAQTRDTADWLPVKLTGLSSTMAFPQMTNHPILRAFKSNDFRWWRGDHMLSAHEPARPTRGGARPLVVTGAAQGVSHAPLLEVPQYDGVWLICQLLVVAKLNVEPAARRLLEQMIGYLAEYEAPRGKTAFQGSRVLGLHLDQFRVDYQALDDWSALEWPRVQLLVLQADGPTIEHHAAELNAFLEAGGTVLLHRPQLKDFPRIRQALRLPLEMQAYHGPVARAETDAPLVGALVREDLYWVDEQAAFGAGPAPRAEGMADGIFVPVIDPTQGESIEVEQRAVLEGAVVKIQSGEVVFGSEGTAHLQIGILETGTYVLTLVARGTPCAGTYPRAAVALDAQTLGIVEVRSAEHAIFPIGFYAEQGDHDLSVAFTNDARAAGEDRNLYLDKLILAQCAESDQAEAITVPPAVVCVPRGRGRLVINAVRWDEPGDNAVRASRFACGLLGGLGARFHAQRPVTVLEAETMKPNADIQAFYAAQDHVLLGANGSLRQLVRIARSGAYRVALWAKGTPVAGTYPIVAIELDGAEIGRVECRSESWAAHETVVRMPAGTATLHFAFTNDLRQSPEDRNLWLDRIDIAPVSDPDPPNGAADWDKRG